jgi:hypothetical protein
VTYTSIYRGFLTKGFIYTTVLQLFTIGKYGFTIHCCCRSSTLINISLLNSPESTISTAVPSHSSHALQPYSFTLSSDSYAVDPLPARNSLTCSLTLLSFGNSLRHSFTLSCSTQQQQLCSPLVVHSPELFASLSLTQHTD